jgi:hypothetical protein
MIELEITENTFITIDHQQQLTATPRMLLDRLLLVITTCDSLSAMDIEMTEVIGSTEDWLHMNRVDSMGFDASTRLLKMVALYYPENNMEPCHLNLLREAEKIRGIPRLTEPSVSFELLPFEYRHYYTDHNLLICFNEAFTTGDQILEIVVSNDLSLFFNNSRYCAWGLYHPETRLAYRIGEEVEHSTNPFLKTSLRDAFDLITDETVSGMVREDASCLKQVAALYNRIVAYAPADGEPLAVLKDWLFDLADKFYPQEMLKDAGLSV